MKDFYKILRTKIELRPDKSVDEKFWAKFESEFGHQKRPFWNFSSPKPLRFGFAALALVAAVTSTVYLQRRDRMSAEREMMAGALTGHQAKMVADLPLFLAFDTLPVSDQEWAVLLPDGVVK